MLLTVCSALFPLLSFPKMGLWLRRGLAGPLRFLTSRLVKRLGAFGLHSSVPGLLMLQFSVFEDESLEDDVWIRSLAFSPDGTHIATGADDKLIRVSLLFAKRRSWL